MSLYKYNDICHKQILLAKNIIALWCQVCKDLRAYLRKYRAVSDNENSLKICKLNKMSYVDVSAIIKRLYESCHKKYPPLLPRKQLCNWNSGTNRGIIWQSESRFVLRWPVLITLLLCVLLQHLIDLKYQTLKAKAYGHAFVWIRITWKILTSAYKTADYLCTISVFHVRWKKNIKIFYRTLQYLPSKQNTKITNFNFGGWRG